MAEEKYKQITYMDMKKDEEVNMLLAHGNQVLKELGFTEHSRKHAAKVAETAGRILKELGYGDREIRLSICMISATVFIAMTMHKVERFWLIRF